MSDEKILAGIDFENEASVAKASSELKKTVEILHHRDDFGRDILDETHKRLKGVEKFSVRSSCTAEDGADASFAGQFATFLSVEKKGLARSVAQCYASLYGLNVLKYCHEKSIPLSALKMNIIIQVMTEPDLSGILFTANPQGLLNESVIVVGEGVGENVVNDKVPSTSYYYNLTDQIYYYESQGGAPLLGVETVNELIKNANRLKPLLGEYLDIEFAIKNEKLFLLQARPITSLSDKNVLILDNSNIVESYPGVSLPLTDSFVCEAYYQVFRGLASRCLKNEKLLKGYDKDLRNMVGSANGRMYYKISNWYAVLNFLPLSKKIIPVWQDMMGVTNKEHKAYKKEISAFQNVRIYFNCIHEAFHVQRGMNKLNADFIEVKESFNAGYKPGLTNAELIALYNQTSTKVLNNWDITLLNDIYAFVFTGLLKNKFKKLKIENYESHTNEYITGVSNIESMKPIKALLALSALAVESGCLDDLKRLVTNEEALEYFNTTVSEFAEKATAYIEDYGDRLLEELKLESETFRTSPILLVNKILEYSDDYNRLKDIAISINASDEFAELNCECGFINKKLIDFYSKKAMLGISNREISRLNRSRVYGIVRKLFLAIGKNMHDAGQIEHEKDVFYLYTSEVFENNVSRDFKNTIAGRKRAYELYGKIPAYSRLEFSGEVFNKSHTAINSDKITTSEEDLSGIPCSNGIVEGEVLMIENPKGTVEAKDKILVTKMTDPGWVFLITLAKGIITEKGSLLSHTAIISRELNIPSIVGVKNISNILKTGDVVKMDGGTGKIEVVRKSDG
ncbi:MAG: phosphoenolpyruvate synthase [Clostridiales bacterium]|nr:phosphoenolpyruvate synthase [Clostridiales bacterium]